MLSELMLLALAASAGSSPGVVIPGGTIVLGTATESIPDLKKSYGIDFPGAFRDEVPEREATLSSFRLDRHEVTYARFSEFLEARPEWSKLRLASDLHNGDYLSDWEDGSHPSDRADHPVAYVTWHSAQAFCRWSGGALPTEAQWEYAARAGGDREFPWGDEPPTPERANYHRTGVDGTTTVGSFPPNDFGLHDLAGNVWEFLLDEWGAELPAGPLKDPVAGGPVEDAELLSISGRRSVRGASFGGSEANLRTRWRDSHVVTNAVAFVGFRCAYPR